MGSSPTAPTGELAANEYFSHRRQKTPASMPGFLAEIGYARASSIAAEAWSRMFCCTWEYVSMVVAMSPAYGNVTMCGRRGTVVVCVSLVVLLLAAGLVARVTCKQMLSQQHKLPVA